MPVLRKPGNVSAKNFVVVLQRHKEQEYQRVKLNYRKEDKYCKNQRFHRRIFLFMYRFHCVSPSAVMFDFEQLIDQQIEHQTFQHNENCDCAADAVLVPVEDRCIH